MASNLLSLLQDELSGDALKRLAAGVGESPSATQSAMRSVVPAVLGGLAERASTTTGASDLLSLVERYGLDGNMFGSLAGALTSGGGTGELLRMGSQLLPAIFGRRQSAVTDWVATTSGVKRSSATSLLTMIVPFILNVVGGQARTTTGLTAEGLANLLTSQVGSLGAAAPAGLASVLGVRSLGDLGGATAASATRVAESAAAAGPGVLRWLIPLLLLVALVIGWRTCRRRPEYAVSAPALSKPSLPSATDLGAFVRRPLPSGVDLNVPERGVESKLIAYLSDAARPIDPNLWFTLDRLEFETGSAILRASSQEQLRNIAAVLKAYPQVELKIGGYTDNVGDAAANLKLSQDRASNTRAALISLGVDGGRVSAQGFGKEHPVASNDTEEGRQRNRRIDLHVTKK
jgi:OmpA-OmpF porin, OOP family